MAIQRAEECISIKPRFLALFRQQIIGTLHSLPGHFTACLTQPLLQIYFTGFPLAVRPPMAPAPRVFNAVHNTSSLFCPGLPGGLSFHVSNQNSACQPATELLQLCYRYPTGYKSSLLRNVHTRTSQHCSWNCYVRCYSYSEAVQNKHVHTCNAGYTITS